MKKALLLVVTAGLMACSGNHKKADVNTTAPAASGSAVSSHSSDTMVVSSWAVVCFTPSAKKVNRMKKELGENDFYTAADDVAYYMGEATIFLDSSCKADGIKMYMCNGDSVSSVRFMLSNGSGLTTLPDTLTELEGIYFFDPAGRRYAADITDISAEYERFFKKQQ